MQIIDNKSKKVAENKIYARRLEGGCIQQFNDCLSQRGVIYGALMPDAHVGYTAPIGSAIVTNGIVYPEWVGYDVGCGILSIPTSFKLEDVSKRARTIFLDLQWKSNICNNIINPHLLPKFLQEGSLSKLGRSVLNSGKCHGFQQLGTLGGGNHFAEIGADLKDRVWITIHSGSRGVGYLIAKAHMEVALYHASSGEEHPGFTARSVQAQAYLNDMEWLLAFASLNRARIAKSVCDAMQKCCKGDVHPTGAVESNHNHIEITNNAYIHRKGCTQADKGTMVNVASNMRDGIFLCKGKGEHDGVYSCAHGAGRNFSRSRAKEVLDPAIFKRSMKGVVCGTDPKYIDESPLAYKPIEDILELQGDLVSVHSHIRPLINIKNGLHK